MPNVRFFIHTTTPPPLHGARNCRDNHMSVPRTLYRQLLLTIRRLHQERLPCTGCVGLPAATAVLCPTAYLQHAFSSNSMPLNGRKLARHAAARSTCSTTLYQVVMHSTLRQMHPVPADAFHAMRMLPRQLAVLQEAEEETRQVTEHSDRTHS